MNEIDEIHQKWGAFMPFMVYHNSARQQNLELNKVEAKFTSRYCCCGYKLVIRCTPNQFGKSTLEPSRCNTL